MARVSSGSNSKQDYATPDEFMMRVESRFGDIQFDLAAHSLNTKHPLYYTAPEFKDDYMAAGIDSLTKDWSELRGLLWLNPPYKDIGPWAMKAARSTAKVAMLVPAVTAAWACDWVFPCADIYLLKQRLSFDGVNTFPKDCMLAVYNEPNATLGNHRRRMAIWDWVNNKITTEWWSV